MLYQVCSLTTVTPTVTPTVRVLLELLHKAGESGSTEIRKAFGIKDRVHVHKSYLQPALQSGYIEMTIPDKPNSRLQKYRLTEKGHKALKSIEGDSDHQAKRDEVLAGSGES